MLAHVRWPSRSKPQGRVDNRVFLRLIKKWLKAGVMEEDGQVIDSAAGTPQGEIISPILANIRLHYVLDLWFQEVVKKRCRDLCGGCWATGSPTAIGAGNPSRQIKELPMPSQIGPVLRWAVAIGTLLLASCGANEAPIAVEQKISPPASTRAPTPIGEPSQTTEKTPPSIEECEEPATEVILGSPVSSEIVGSNQPPRERKYFCVRVPDGASSITFELTSTTSDLNLYVGHPDLETVQQGGIWFWSTNERGVEDKVIVVEPALTDYVNPGPYYIEVSAEDFRESSPFTLSVRTR